MSFLRSVRSFLWGILKRAYAWGPFILLDLSDFFLSYITRWFPGLGTLSIALPPQFYVILPASGLFLAALLTYHELKVDYDTRIKSVLEINFRPTGSHVQEQQYQLDQGQQGILKLFRISVRVTGINTVEGVQVHLESTQPQIFSFLPLPLHLMHDNYMPHQTEFSIDEGQELFFDVVQKIMTKAPPVPRNVPLTTIQVTHTVPGIDRVVSQVPCELTIRATGRNVPSARRRFIVNLNESEELTFHENA